MLVCLSYILGPRKLFTSLLYWGPASQSSGWYHLYYRVLSSTVLQGVCLIEEMALRETLQAPLNM